MQVTNPALVTSLRLLFDGIKTEEASDALVEAFGFDKSQSLVYDLGRSAGVNIVVSVCPADIISYLSDEGERTFVGTPAELKTALLDADTDVGDLYTILRDEIIEELEEKGLIKELEE